MWDTTLDPKPGLTVVEIMDAVHAGKIRGMYIMGENPAMSDPDVKHARQALAELEMLVVQDIFLTETAYLADVILPASAFPEKTGTFTNTDRTVQLGRQALKPPGEARQDLDIIIDIGRRLGLDWTLHASARRVRGDAHCDAVDRGHHVGAPRARERGDLPVRAGRRSRRAASCSPRTSRTPSGRAQLVPAVAHPRRRAAGREYPFVLITGRQLEHWHTGSMTRRTEVLDAIEPGPVASFHPDDLAALESPPGSASRSHRAAAQIALYARADDGTPRGACFIPFCYYEAAANVLTNPGARSVRQDSRVQVLRGQGIRRRRGRDRIRIRAGVMPAHNWHCIARFELI